MGNWLDPKATEDVTEEGWDVTYKVRTPSAADSAAIDDAASTLVEVGDEKRLAGKQMIGAWVLESLRRCLVGWSGDGAPEFISGTKGGAADESIDRIPWARRVAIAKAIERLVLIGPEAKPVSQS